MSKYEAILGRKTTDAEKAKLARAEATRAAAGDTARDPKAYDGSKLLVFDAQGNAAPAARFMPESQMTSTTGVTYPMEGTEALERHNYWHPGDFTQEQVDAYRAEAGGPGYTPPVFPVSKASIVGNDGNPHRIQKPSDYDALAQHGIISAEDAAANKAWFQQQFPQPIMPAAPPPSMSPTGLQPSSASYSPEPAVGPERIGAYDDQEYTENGLVKRASVGRKIAMVPVHVAAPGGMLSAPYAMDYTVPTHTTNTMGHALLQQKAK